MLFSMMLKMVYISRRRYVQKPTLHETSWHPLFDSLSLFILGLLYLPSLSAQTCSIDNTTSECGRMELGVKKHIVGVHVAFIHTCFDAV